MSAIILNDLMSAIILNDLMSNYFEIPFECNYFEIPFESAIILNDLKNAIPNVTGQSELNNWSSMLVYKSNK